MIADTTIHDLIVSAAPTLVAGAAWLTAWSALTASKNNSKAIAHVDKVAVATHELSNSAMEAQLLANVQNLEMGLVFARRLADTGTEADKAAAKALEIRVEAAKQEHREHQLKQAKVDAREAA